MNEGPLIVLQSLDLDVSGVVFVVTYPRARRKCDSLSGCVVARLIINGTALHLGLRGGLLECGKLFV